MQVTAIRALAGLLALVAGTGLAACGGPEPQALVLGQNPSVAAPGSSNDSASSGPHPTRPSVSPPTSGEDPARVVTIAFAGDMHFELHLAALLDHPRGALGPIAKTLAAADLSMVNLETSITSRGTRLHMDYAFRTSPKALDVLAAAGIDVATMANNHGVDYGPVGLADTLKAVRNSPIPVIGIGADQKAAFQPYRVSVEGTTFAFFAASSEPDQLTRSAARPHKAGIAAAFADRPATLLSAVRAASERGDVVVVYLHWGTELHSCPTTRQTVTAQALAAAGADAVVGSHAHVQLGSGWLGRTYVNYGLGNFLWYHDMQPHSGVLQLQFRDGAVVSDSWTPARIQPDGRPLPLTGDQRTAAIADWRRLRGCTDLSAEPPRPSRQARPSRPAQPAPAYQSSIQQIGPDLAARMRYSHHSGCPTPLADLRYLRMTYLGFDGSAHTGEMVVHTDFAADVTEVFERLYEARWPIRQMRLVDDFQGRDGRSMAANNTSGYNCRRVAGRAAWSEHAFGAAIDVNPVQNPDLTGPRLEPSTGARFANVGRSASANPPNGVIRAGDVVVRAFADIGWTWGGDWSAAKDYQHFSASGR